MLIDIKENETGFLLPINFNNLPFTPKRIFIIKNKFAGASRGYHAHREDQQILFVLNGKIKISYENLLEKDNIFLQFGETYISKPFEWLEIDMIDKNSIVLVLCSVEYDEKEYIRSYEEFRKILREQI